MLHLNIVLYNGELLCSSYVRDVKHTYIEWSGVQHNGTGTTRVVHREVAIHISLANKPPWSVKHSIV